MLTIVNLLTKLHLIQLLVN